jgi:hypothetical protein
LACHGGTAVVGADSSWQQPVLEPSLRFTLVPSLSWSISLESHQKSSDEVETQQIVDVFCSLPFLLPAGLDGYDTSESMQVRAKKPLLFPCSISISV